MMESTLDRERMKNARKAMLRHYVGARNKQSGLERVGRHAQARNQRPQIPIGVSLKA
jgi:hypothetical protein